MSREAVLEEGVSMQNKSGIDDRLLEEIKDWALKEGLDKVIMFGSRARGDFRRTSDIDLAIAGGNTTNFILNVNEETNTLLKYDIVDLAGSVQDELLQSIMREGILIYEKI